MPEYSLTAHGCTYRIEAEGRIGDVIAYGIPYEAELLEYIYEQHFEGLALDIGAHVGNHALWFAIVCKLAVHAFEPLVAPRLVRNVALNHLTNVQVYNVALGAQDGWARAVGKGELVVGDGGVPVRTLDSFNLLGVSMIKIDVESMEAEVLAGSKYTLEHNRPVIFAEARTPEDHAAIAAVLTPWDYRMTRRFASKSVASPVERWDGA